MKIKVRNLVLEADALAYEGSHSILYKAYTDNFGKPCYNYSILTHYVSPMDNKTYETWKGYMTGMAVYNPDSLQSLITSATRLNEQAKLVHENKDNIEELVRMCNKGLIPWHMIYDITGYYVSEKAGEFVGPNNHRGIVDLTG